MTTVHPQAAAPSDPSRLAAIRAAGHRDAPRMARLAKGHRPRVLDGVRRSGVTARLTVPGVVDLVLVDRPDDVEQVFLRKQDVYTKGPEYDVPALGLV